MTKSTNMNGGEVQMTDRDPKTGRFAKVDPVRDVLAPGLGAPREYASPLRRRYAPAGDTLAGASYHGLLHPRIARQVSGGSEREVYATPHARTLRDAVTTTETGRPVAAEMTYLTGDIDQSAPGEPGQLGPYGARLSPDAHLRVEGDDAATARFGIQGRHGRDAARKSGDPMDASRFLTGAE